MPPGRGVRRGQARIWTPQARNLCVKLRTPAFWAFLAVLAGLRARFVTLSAAPRALIMAHNVPQSVLAGLWTVLRAS